MTPLILTAPPSVNALYANIPGKGRIKTGVYKQWIELAGWDIRKAKIKPFDQPVVITLQIGKVNQRRDLDGFYKAAIDLFVTHGIIKNDNLNYVHEVRAIKAFGIVPDECISIMVEGINDA